MVLNSREDLVKFASDVLKTNFNGSVKWFFLSQEKHKNRRNDHFFLGSEITNRRQFHSSFELDVLSRGLNSQ